MRRHRPCVAISGYYGCGNAGDEAVLGGIVVALRDLMPDIRIIVLTSDPELTSKLHTGVETARRYNIGDLIKAIRACDLFISGGGSLLQDASSARSSFYYLGVMSIARHLHRKRLVYAQGIGPLFRANIRKAVKSELAKADFISVRDEDSRDLLGEIGIDIERIELVSDPAFLVKADVQAADAVLAEYGLAGRPLLSVFLRNWPGIESVVPIIRESVEEFCRQSGLSAVAVSMQDCEDVGVAHDLGIGPVVASNGDFRMLKGIVARSSVVMAMRLHSLIFAASEGVPFIPIVYDPKVSSFSRSIMDREGILVGDVEKEKLVNDLRDVYSNASLIGSKLKDICGSMAENARIPALRVRELLEQ